MTARFLVGDVFDRMAELPDGSVDLAVTSPPFLALRSYLPADHPDKHLEIGSEPTPAAFIDTLLRLTSEWRRLLAPHGSICVELGDTYSGSGGGGGDYLPGGLREGQAQFAGSGASMRESNAAHWRQKNGLANYSDDRGNPDGMRDTTFSGANTRTGGGSGWPLAKSKTLIPELYRIALAYGIHPLTGTQSPAGSWRVRNVVTWCRPNPPVGALGDKWRPATSDIVIACTSPKRYWDDLATRQPGKPNHATLGTPRSGPKGAAAEDDLMGSRIGPRTEHPAGAPLLDYWEIPPGGYPGSHYAVYPPSLIEPLIKAMAPPRVCIECGKPSRRITKMADDYARVRAAVGDFKTGSDRSTGLNGTRQYVDGQHVETATYETIGWSDCGHDAWRHGLVLDPFAGTGTTLMVATGHGLNAIGIDLDARNVDLARERCGMFLETSV